MESREIETHVKFFFQHTMKEKERRTDFELLKVHEEGEPQVCDLKDPEENAPPLSVSKHIAALFDDPFFSKTVRPFFWFLFLNFTFIS